jgi:hypothetical protein
LSGLLTHRRDMQDAVQRFESEMTELLVEQWRGCSWEVVALGARHFPVSRYYSNVMMII